MGEFVTEVINGAKEASKKLRIDFRSIFSIAELLKVKDASVSKSTVAKYTSCVCLYVIGLAIIGIVQNIIDCGVLGYSSVDDIFGTLVFLALELVIIVAAAYFASMHGLKGILIILFTISVWLCLISDVCSIVGTIVFYSGLGRLMYVLSAVDSSVCMIVAIIAELARILITVMYCTTTYGIIKDGISTVGEIGDFTEIEDDVDSNGIKGEDIIDLDDGSTEEFVEYTIGSEEDLK